MATRIGIELSPVDCRIVEIETSGRGTAAETSVRSLSVSPVASGETRTQLARLRGREVAVVAWGLRGDHRQTIVNAGRYEAMRREAISSLKSAGIDMRGVLTDIAPAGPRTKEGSRRPVVMALASRKDVASVLRPLTAAGIRVKSLVTPGAALGSIARLRRGRGALSGVEAYVSLEENATCIALVRQHVLVGACELPWGYVQEHEPFRERVPRDKVAARLADELIEFFSAAGVEPGSVSVVCICGTLPELRSMTMPLMERLDLEVEPLDSMFGVDSDQLSEQTRDFRERGVELRLAWAAAADWEAPLNLLRERQRRATAAIFARAAVVAGVGAGVTLGWGAQQTAWLQAAVRTPSATQVSRTVETRQEPNVTPARTAVPIGTPAPIETPEPADAPLPMRTIASAPPSEPVPSESSATVSDVARPVGTSASAAPVEKPIATRVATPIMHEPVFAPEPMAEPIPIVTRYVEPVPVSTATRTPVQRQEPPPRVNASSNELGSILFGPDRKLALIDGRIVGAGDDVAGSTVIEIAPTSVTLRDRAGRLRKLSLGGNRH